MDIVTDTYLKRFVQERLRISFCIALVLSLGGCVVQKTFKSGLEFEEAGYEYKAALAYIEVLDLRDTHRKAREELSLIAEAAYDEKVGIASRYESDARYADALNEYRELGKFLARLKSEDMLSFATVDVLAKIDEMQSSAAEVEYQRAEQAVAAGKWEEAISSYRGAQSFKSDYKDTDTKIGSAFYSWAEEDLSAKRWRLAAGHFAEARDAAGPAFEDAGPRAGGLLAALGRHFLETGSCRRATLDLRRARALFPEAASEEEVARAEACAMTAVAVLPLENATGRNVGGIALGDALADLVMAKSGESGSEFLRILERGALDTVRAEQALAGGGEGVSSASYLVLGKLTQVQADTPDPSVTRKTAPGREPYECTKTNPNSGKTYQATCWNDVDVSYSEISSSSSVTIAGNIYVVETRAGDRVLDIRFNEVMSDAVTWAEGFTVGGRPVAIEGGAGRGGVQVESSLERLEEAKRPLRDEASLATMILEKVASDSTSRVLSVVDAEERTEDPETLTW